MNSVSNTKENKAQDKKGEIEGKVIRTLTDKRLSAVKAMLEKDHAIDCMFLLMLGRGQWKYAKEFMNELGLTLPDGTFRARMLEIELSGLASHENIDAKKRRWIITEFGQQVGNLLLGVFSHMADGGAL